MGTGASTRPADVILGDLGAVSRVDKMFVVKVFCTVETSPWALTLTEPVPEALELPASDWPEKNFVWPISASTTSERVTHLHIPVPAITRGTLARTHELKMMLFYKDGFLCNI